MSAFSKDSLRFVAYVTRNMSLSSLVENVQYERLYAKQKELSTKSKVILIQIIKTFYITCILHSVFIKQWQYKIKALNLNIFNTIPAHLQGNSRQV